MSLFLTKTSRRHRFAWIVIAMALGALVFVSACGGGAEKLLAQADALAHTANADSAAMANALYASFLTQYPEHEYAPRALRTQARLTQQRRDIGAALVLYESLLSSYPESAYADEAQFMIGYIYEEHVRDFDRARAAYQRVIDRYPDSELAMSAKHLLPHVGRAAEEWVEFQEGVTDAVVR